MGATAAIGLFGSVALGLMNSFQQAKAVDQQGEFQQQQLNANARLAGIQAEDATRRGQEAARDHRQRVRVLIGQNRANLAAQNIEIDDGSALDVQLNNAEIGAVDEARIKNNAWREAWGYKVTASDYMTQADVTGLAAKNKSRDTIITGGLSAVRDLSYGYYSATKGSTVSGAGGNRGASFIA